MQEHIVNAIINDVCGTEKQLARFQTLPQKAEYLAHLLQKTGVVSRSIVVHNNKAETHTSPVSTDDVLAALANLKSISYSLSSEGSIELSNYLFACRSLQL